MPAARVAPAPMRGRRMGAGSEHWSHWPAAPQAALRTVYGPETMAVDVLTEIVIARPVAEVAAFAGDPSRAPEWYANIKSVEWVTPPPATVGSRLAFVAHFLGRRLAYTYEIRALSADHLVMSTAEGPFPMETTYTWTAEGPHTRMTLRNRGEPSGFSAVVAPIMAMMLRRANEADLRKLKAVLEAR